MEQKYSESSHDSDGSEEFIMSKEYKKLLDHKQILKGTKNKINLKVTLKKDKTKGVGLYATEKIMKGDVIAYYKITACKGKEYDSPTNFMYSFEVYKKNGDEYKRFIGDIDLNSFPDPKNDITYWAPFANEPSKGQKSNAELDMNLQENYKNRTKIKVGQSLIYKLEATRHINPGDEILWFYGPDYHRNYEVSRL